MNSAKLTGLSVLPKLTSLQHLTLRPYACPLSYRSDAGNLREVHDHKPSASLQELELAGSGQWSFLPSWISGLTSIRQLKITGSQRFAPGVATLCVDLLDRGGDASS